MRALALVFAATLCACRFDAGAADPASVTSAPASVRVRVLVTLTAAPGPPSAPREHAPAQPTSASACFSEPVTYHKMAARGPMPADADARLLRCGALAEEARAACRFALAREYFDAKRFERAGPLFLTVAHDRAAVDAATAAQLGLESMNMLIVYADPSRAACSELMANEIPRLLAELCTPTPPPGAERVCAMMHIIDVDLTRCSECVTATVSGRDPDAAYRAAAQIYLDLAGAQCVLGKGKQARNESLRCAELLYDAYRWSSKGHDPSRAARAKALLRDPRNGLEQTDLAKRLLHRP